MCASAKQKCGACTPLNAGTIRRGPRARTLGPHEKREASRISRCGRAPLTRWLGLAVFAAAAVIVALYGEAIFVAFDAARASLGPWRIPVAAVLVALDDRLALITFQPCAFPPFPSLLCAQQRATDSHQLTREQERKH